MSYVLVVTESFQDMPGFSLELCTDHGDKYVCTCQAPDVFTYIPRDGLRVLRVALSDTDWQAIPADNFWRIARWQQLAIKPRK